MFNIDFIKSNHLGYVSWSNRDLDAALQISSLELFVDSLPQELEEEELEDFVCRSALAPFLKRSTDPSWFRVLGSLLEWVVLRGSNADIVVKDMTLSLKRDNEEAVWEDFGGDFLFIKRSYKGT